MKKTPLAQFVAACVDNHIPYREAVEEFRRAWLVEALRRNGNNQCAVAQEIGVHRNTIGRTIKSLHVQIPDGKRKARHNHAATA